MHHHAFCWGITIKLEYNYQIKGYCWGLVVIPQSDPLILPHTGVQTYIHTLYRHTHTHIHTATYTVYVMSLYYYYNCTTSNDLVIYLFMIAA